MITFERLIAEVLSWGLKPEMVTGDTWYSSRENLKFLKNHKLGFMMGIAKNRQIAITPGKYISVRNIEIPSEGQVVYLKEFGPVKVFRKMFKNDIERYYIIFSPAPTETEGITRVDFLAIHSIHWGIECYHRAIKQLCGVKRFLVRTRDGADPRGEGHNRRRGEEGSLHPTQPFHNANRYPQKGFPPLPSQPSGRVNTQRVNLWASRYPQKPSPLLQGNLREAILTHFFCSIRAFIHLELMRAEALIDNWYEIQRNLSLEVARDFILNHLNQKVGLKAEY